MTPPRRLAMLGSGLIADAYAEAIARQGGAGTVATVYSRTAERAARFAARHGVGAHTSDLATAVNDPGIDAVVVALPNDQHELAVTLAAKAAKAVLCTKPLGRNTEEAARMLDAVESAGVFAGYLEDLCYPPKTTSAVAAVRAGAIGRVHWVRSREAHGGPHSQWFFDPERAGGGSLVDLGSHCVEIIRNFVGKQDRPVAVMCWSDTLAHDTAAEDNAIALIRFASGAIGQFEVSWSFRGGMDLRDEVCGSLGTIRLDHFLRTGFEIFSVAEPTGVAAEKAERLPGWQFPVGDQAHALGNVDMFADMFAAMAAGRAPRETFYDGYVVNAVLDTCYRSVTSGRWEPVELRWRG